MELIGRYHLFTRDGAPVPCDAWWLSGEADWHFVKDWEAAAGAAASIRDSIEYAQIGRKRWQWLSQRGETADSLTDAKRRVQEDAECEFAFAIMLRLRDGKGKPIVGFCYARRVWTGSLCLEFLGVTVSQDIAGGGSLLMYALSATAVELRCAEIWGECTKASQGFYLRIKQRLGRTLLEVTSGGPMPERADPETPERFSFNSSEIGLMKKALQRFMF